MFELFGSKKKEILKPKTKDELKVITRILFIDDQKIDIVDAIAKEGWKVKYIPDLDSYQNVDLIDSHIICIDINGVGKALKFNNGMELVAAIRKMYPFKKIILYSSDSQHDIFHESLDLIDKRLQKTGQPFPFLTAIEELANKTFDWDNCIFDIFNKYKGQFGTEITFDEFKNGMKKVFKGDNKIDKKKIIEITKTSIDIAEIIYKICINLVNANRG